MTKHEFDFDDSMTVLEFFKKNRVAKGQRKFITKNCTAESGDVFPAVGFATGDTLDDGRPEYQWFVLSRKLEDEASNEKELKLFLKAHKEEVLLLEPVDDLKFGIVFLAGGADDWDEL
jgi:hypothetical protein